MHTVLCYTIPYFAILCYTMLYDCMYVVVWLCDFLCSFISFACRASAWSLLSGFGLGSGLGLSEAGFLLRDLIKVTMGLI